MCDSRRFSADRRAATLVETIVYFGLFALLMTGVYAVVVASVRNYMVGANSCELQSAAMNALEKLAWEITETNSGSLRLDTDPPGLVFASPRNIDDGKIQVDASGNLLWQTLVCYYIAEDNGTKMLRRRYEKIDPAVSVPPFIPATKNTAYFAAANDLKTHRVADNIILIGLSGNNTLKITLTAFKSALYFDDEFNRQQNRIDKVEVSTRLTLKN
jgi:hypothetical protein